MSDYVIISDSSVDLPGEMVEKLGIEILPLAFTVKGETYHNYPDDREMPAKDFYKILRTGEMCTTSAVNVGGYTEVIEPFLQAGKDVLVLAFSSGLSATYQSSTVAVSELQEKYPQRKIFTVDTLSASLGQGLLVWHAVNLKNEGATVEAVRDWVEEQKLHLCHWFTVDDLHFLKRGGRVSATTAIVGTMLSVKPVMHMDNEGHLVKVGIARGRGASLKALVDHMAQLAIDPGQQTVFISHGDCVEDAEKVAADVKARFGTKTVLIHNVGPVIGAHSGPGTIALFFLGTER